MTDGVKIPISADPGGVTTALNTIERDAIDASKAMEKAAQSKFDGLDLAVKNAAALNRELKRTLDLQKAIATAQKRAGTQGGAKRPRQRKPTSQAQPTQPASNMPSSAPSPVPGARPTPGTLPVPGASRRRINQPRSPGAYTTAPRFSSVGQNLISGFGGGVGQIANYAHRGAVAGARSSAEAGESSVSGGGIGLLRGGAIGALAFGGLKAGQAIAEGYDMAKERNATLDELKRQMGDLGISFRALEVMSDGAAAGLGINSKESAKLALEFNRVSRGAEKDPESLVDSVRTSVGVANAYGQDPSVGVNFMAGMKQIDPRQNNRELAVMLAEAIYKSGMSSRADEVMQSIQSFATSTARMSLSAPNTSAYAAGYASMMSSGTRGMTSETASSILAQANQGFMKMGGAGEAGQNFMSAAFNRFGTLNPIEAKALAQGGIFGTRAQVFGDKDSALGKYFGGEKSGLVNPGNANITNLEAVKAHIDRTIADKNLRLEGFQRTAELSSLSHAAALYNMDATNIGGLHKAIKSSGVDINTINTGGLQTLAKIGAVNPAGPDSMGKLNSIYGEMSARPGAGSLTVQDKEGLEAAKGQGAEKFQDALIKIAAAKDRQETDASKTIQTIKDLETEQTRIGNLMIAPMNTMSDALLAIAGKYGKSATARSLHERMLSAERDDIASSASDASSKVDAQANNDAAGLRKKEDELKKRLVIRQYDSPQVYGAPDKQKKDEGRKEAESIHSELDGIQKRRAEIEAKRITELQKIEDQRKKALTDIEQREAQIAKGKPGAAPGPLDGAAVKAGSSYSPAGPSAGGAQAAPPPASAAAVQSAGVTAGKPSPDKIFNALTRQESGSRHRDANGNLITSSKGARGITQIMRATGANPGYGVKPLQDESEEEFLRFGKDYLNALRKEFGGDEAKALAAYNAGPGNVRKAEKAGGADWLKHLPKETQAYVPSIMKIAAADTTPDKLPEQAAGPKARSGTPDILNVNINYAGPPVRSANGTVTTPTANATVAVPRGAGVVTANVHAN